MSGKGNNPFSPRKRSSTKGGGWEGKSGVAANEGEAQKSEAELEQSPPLAPTAGHAYLEANGAIEQLRTMARQGDGEAACFLRVLIVEATSSLYDLCTEDSKLKQAAGRPGEPWPLLTSSLTLRGGYPTVPTEHPLRKLGVLIGERSFSLDAPGTRAAYHLFSIIDFYRRSIPQAFDDPKVIAARALRPLSKSNHRAWWKLMKREVELQWGKEFQDDSAFAKIATTDQERGIRRSRIMSAIESGLKSIAVAADHRASIT